MNDVQQKRVLWVDEDQWRLPSVAFVARDCNAKVESAYSVAEAMKRLSEDQDFDAVILDAIVTLGGAVVDDRFYSGLELLAKMEPALRERTLVLSLVSPERLKSKIDLPQGRVFQKIRFARRLKEFREALKKILEGKLADQARRVETETRANQAEEPNEEGDA